MHAQMWNSLDFHLMDEPSDTDIVVSDKVWKKFNLDSPGDGGPNYHNESSNDENIASSQMQNTRLSCCISRKIRHHDCMWAGLCISTEHNRTIPAIREKVQRKVAAGKSLLISQTLSSSQSTQEPKVDNKHFDQKQTQDQVQLQKTRQSHGSHQKQQRIRANYNLVSGRPETPKSSTESNSESEYEAPTFKHDQFSINEKLVECMSQKSTAVPVSEITGQQLVIHQLAEEIEVANTDAISAYTSPIRPVTNFVEQTRVQNTPSDHCYHIHQLTTKKMDHLGVQTPMDSEEEIDVVTYEKPSKLTAILPYSRPAEKKNFQTNVDSTIIDEQSQRIPQKILPRPRGRPKLNPDRKLDIPEQKLIPRSKQTVVYEKKSKTQKLSLPPPPIIYKPIKACLPSKSSSDEEPETDKRNFHNNMERQRRIELRNAFEDLRCLVPEIAAKENAPKVTILRQATNYCCHLGELDSETFDLRKRQEKLRDRLRFLRQSLASRR